MSMTQEKLNKALRKAAGMGQPEKMQGLIDRGAQVEAGDQDHYDARPMHEAAMRGHLAVAGLLLRNGALIDVRDTNGNRPLHLAALNGHLAMAEFLLKNDADPEARNEMDNAPLDLVEGYPEVRELLKKWSEPGFREKIKWEGTAQDILAHRKRIAARLPAPGPRL